MTQHHVHSTDAVLAVVAVANRQRRALLVQAVAQVAQQLNVHKDTLLVWLDVLDGPAVPKNNSAGLPLLGLLHHTCGMPFVAGRDILGQPAYVCHCPATPVIGTHVAHLHVLAQIGLPTRRMVQRHGLTGLAVILTAIRLDNAGALVAVAWRPPAGPVSTTVSGTGGHG